MSLVKLVFEGPGWAKRPGLPRSRAGTMSPRPGSGLWSEDASLARGPVLPLGSPMILGAGFAPGLVQDGGSVAGDAEPEGPALVSFFLGDPALQLLSLRGL